MVRTKWLNGKLQQTTFLDKQNRVLEEFTYGYSNEKRLFRYEADRKVFSAWYYHSDSHEPGYAYLNENRYEYDKSGLRIHGKNAHVNSFGIINSSDTTETPYTYKIPYDTLANQAPKRELDSSTIANIDRWERSKNGKMARHFVLYVIKMSREQMLDTVYYQSQRFAHDVLGRQKLAWFDIMHLGRFYQSAGADTIHYQYDTKNRLVQELHLFTTDMRNKREVDTTHLDKSTRQSVAESRKQFFVPSNFRYNRRPRIDTVTYQYETFNSDKHLPLQVSQDVGH